MAAALDFPNSPATNDVFNAPNGAAYQWDGSVWKIATASGSPIVISATPPASPVVGQQWWRNDPDGSLFLYYDDGNTKQWVPAVSYTGGPSGPAGGGDLAGTYPSPTLLTVGAQVYSSTFPTIPNNAGTDVSFDTSVVNRGSAWSSGAPTRIFLSKPGVYLVGALICWTTNASGMRASIIFCKAGATGLRADTGATPATGVTMQVVQGLYVVTDPTDYVYLSLYQNSGAPLALAVNLPTFYAWRLAT